MACSLWFNYGAYWEHKDVEWAANYFAAVGLSDQTLIQAARHLGRQPDSIMVKLTKQRDILPTGNGYRPAKGEGSVTEEQVRRLSDLSSTTINSRYPIDPNFDPQLFYGNPPPVTVAKLVKPDDRVVYLSAGQDGKITAANLKWEEAAEIGISEKRVVDITAEAKALLEKMPPLDALVLRTAIKEGKV